MTENQEKKAVAHTSTVVSAIVNVMLSSAQIGIGLLSHSQGLVADGLHSLSDLFADGVVLFANQHSHKAPDDDHHYGHARFENAASLVLGVLLLVVGLGMLWAGAQKIQSNEPLPTVHVSALWAALAALAVKEGLFRYMLAKAKRVNSAMLIANAWHARSDAASSLVVAVGIVASLFGYPIFDPLAAIVVGLMICKMGGTFSLEAMHQLTDRALSIEEVNAIRSLLNDVPGVRNVHDLKTRQMGDYAVVDAHLDVDAWISVSEGHLVAANARRALIQKPNIMDAQIHIDPTDADASITVALPTRAQVLQLFNESIASKPADIILHYLSGKLFIDVVFNSNDVTDNQAISIRTHIEKELSQQFGDLVVLRRFLLTVKTYDLA
jgi:cation diffusion facilitator family transporter